MCYKGPLCLVMVVKDPTPSPRVRGMGLGWKK